VVLAIIMSSSCQPVGPSVDDANMLVLRADALTLLAHSAGLRAANGALPALMWLIVA